MTRTRRPSARASGALRIAPRTTFATPPGTAEDAGPAARATAGAKAAATRDRRSCLLLGSATNTLAERMLHLATQLHRRGGGVEGDVAPLERLPRLHRMQHLPAVGEAERQAVSLERGVRGHQAADDRIAALAVEDFSDLQILLGRCDGIGSP